MDVEQIMTRNVGVCTFSDDLSRAARIMWEGDCGCVPIVDGRDGGPGRVVGMVTDRDVCMAAYTQGRPLHEIPVASVGEKNIVSCRPSDSVDIALRMMRAHQVHRLPVVDEEGALVGIVSLCDVARQAAREEGYWTRSVSPSDLGRTVEAISAPRADRAVAATAA